MILPTEASKVQHGKKLFEFLMKMLFLDTLITQNGSLDSEIYSSQDSELDVFSENCVVVKL